jgi:ankyrin repeat protein
MNRFQMKLNLWEVILFLSFCVLQGNVLAQNNQSDFPQIVPPKWNGNEPAIDTNLPMAEKIKLLISYSAYGFTNEVVKLIQSGVPVNSTNAAGDTVLTWLSKMRPDPQQQRLLEFAKYLIQQGVDPNARDRRGKTAADYAAEYGGRQLLSIVDVAGKYKSQYQDTKLQDAQTRLLGTVGDLTIESMTTGGNLPADSYAKVKDISKALNDGAIPDQEVMLEALGGASSECYWLPLGQIMPEAISELVKAGAKVNEPLANGLQPLFYAVSKPKLFQMLLDAGADPRKNSMVMWTSLSKNYQQEGIGFKFIREPIICEAAEFGVPEVLDKLLRDGVSIEERDSEGNTPLHRAVTFANADAIDFLMRHRASLEATNNKGLNALDMAAACANLDFVRAYDKTGRYHKILEDYPGSLKSPVIGKWAAQPGSTNVYLRFAPEGGGEIYHFIAWKKPLAWRTNQNSIEVFAYCPEIPRMPGNELEPGWVVYDPKTDTCVLHWRDGPEPWEAKLFRMK